jgi:hypothetical protein
MVMSTILLPDHHLIRQPEITVFSMNPVRFADGLIVRPHRDMMEMIFYCERRGEVIASEQVCLPRAGFDRSLILMAAEFLPALSTEWRH